MCVCVYSSHSFWTSSSLDVPAGVTQEEGHTGFLIHLLSAVRALIFLARRIQPFLSLVDREVEFCVLTIQSFSTRWAFLFLFFSFLVRKISFAGIELTSHTLAICVTIHTHALHTEMSGRNSSPYTYYCTSVYKVSWG